MVSRWKDIEDAGGHANGRPIIILDNINQWIQITIPYRRPQPLEGNRQSSDTGQQSYMICRNEEDTAHRVLSPTTSLFGSAFLCHDKHVPCGAMQPTTNSRCRKKKVLLGGPLGRGPPSTCPIGPMVNPALMYSRPLSFNTADKPRMRKGRILY